MTISAIPNKLIISIVKYDRKCAQKFKQTTTN